MGDFTTIRRTVSSTKVRSSASDELVRDCISGSGRKWPSIGCRSNRLDLVIKEHTKRADGEVGVGRSTAAAVLVKSEDICHDSTQFKMFVFLNI